MLGVWVPLLADPCILVTLISLKNGSTAESIWCRGVRGIILVFRNSLINNETRPRFPQAADSRDTWTYNTGQFCSQPHCDFLLFTFIDIFATSHCLMLWVKSKIYCPGYWQSSTGVKQKRLFFGPITQMMLELESETVCLAKEQCINGIAFFPHFPLFTGTCL